MYSEDGKNAAMILENGCYKNGEPAFYERAMPDKVYKFEYVPVEVRSKSDPYVALTQQGYILEVENSWIISIMYMLTMAAIVFAILTTVMYCKAKADVGEEGQALRI